jgi:hypothetical protein
MGVVCLRVCWNGTQIPLRLASAFYEVNITPSAEYPFGQRGKYMVRAWQMLNSGPVTYGQESYRPADGMLLLDGDVAIDPWDLEVMVDAVREDNQVVHVAPMKLWPVSTRAESWVWAYGENEFRGIEPDGPVNLFTFGFTYLPKLLIHKCIYAGMEEWVYPDVDTNVCMTAMKAKIPVNVVYACQPKHCNY